jgi:hypothetical protein
VADLDTLVSQVWNPEVRHLAAEALRCYNAGAIRASIAATWTAVTADIITKLIGLADDGDKGAVPFRDAVADARDKGLGKEGVRAMQAIEADLLANAVKFELIDAIDVRELGRIHEDRNLCVHPSLRHHGGAYEPHPEVARSHLVVALTALLTHPPTQGARALEEFQNYICDASFSPTLTHMQATFFDRVRTAARRGIIRVAAKHALLELDPGGRMPAIEHADRMAVALEAFAGRDRELVREALVDQRDRFKTAEGLVQVRALLRFADKDYFWDLVDGPLADRLQDLALPSSGDPAGAVLSAETASALTVVRSRYVHDRLPKLEARFLALPRYNQMLVAAAHPDPYFVPLIPAFLNDARSWRVGEQAGQILVQHAAFLTLDTLQAALTAWVENYECRTANLMQSLAAVDLLQRTAHLGRARAVAFHNFVDRAHELESSNGSTGFYTYALLATALTALW